MVLRGIVESDRLLLMDASRGQLSEEVDGCPQRIVGDQQERRGVGALSQAEALLGQFARRLVLCPHQVKPL